MREAVEKRQENETGRGRGGEGKGGRAHTPVFKLLIATGSGTDPQAGTGPG